MPFLILTRAGFDDLIARVDPAGAVFHLNPGLIPADEIARLRDAGAGADVNVLARAVDPRAPNAVEQALRTEGATVWIERAPHVESPTRRGGDGWPKPPASSPAAPCNGDATRAAAGNC